MVQVWGCDDMLSLRNFYLNFITFWSSQGNLSCKKSKKTEENVKFQNVSRFVKNVLRFVKNVTRFHKAECMLSTIRKTCHDG